MLQKLKGLGVGRGDRRRHGDRRADGRGKRERRRGDRRRKGMQTVILAVATTLAAPSLTRGAPRIKASASSVGKATPLADAPLPEFQLPPHLAYESLIQEASAIYQLDPALVRAVMQVESAFDPSVVSRVGAQGLMQLMPALAQEMGVTDPFDPRDNIMGGVRYLSELLRRHRGNLELTLASYNAGPTAVARYHGIPPFRETRRYVKAITDIIARDRRSSTD